MKVFVRQSRFVAITPLTALLLACGGGGGSTTSSTPPPPSGGAEACTANSYLLLKTTQPLRARSGSVFSTTLYDPSLSSGNGTHKPQLIEVQAETRRGIAARDCRIQWQTGRSSDNGWAFPVDEKTDAQGIARVWWLAGNAPAQTLQAGLLFDGKEVSRLAINGSTEHHATRANSIHITWQADNWTDFSAEVTPLTFPPTTYYEVVGFPGGYTGIQSHQLLFSVWDVGGKDAKVIRSSAGVICSDFGGEGTGRKCEKPFTPKVGNRYRFRVQLTRPDNDNTDYTMYFTDMNGDGIEREYATLRYASPVSTRDAYGFIEDWAGMANGCLNTPARSARYGNVRYRTAASDTWLPLTRAQASAVYTPNHNEICGNYYFGVENGEFKWSTGGNELISAPLNLTPAVNNASVVLTQ